MRVTWRRYFYNPSPSLRYGSEHIYNYVISVFIGVMGNLGIIGIGDGSLIYLYF
jgi:hypothetical protein